MKKLILALPFILASCATNPVDAFFMAKFDNNEYQIATDIRTVALTVDCTNNINVLESSDKEWYLSNELVNYTQYQPNNAKSHEMAVALLDIVKGLHDKTQTGKVSKVYCDEKFNLIATTTEDIQRATGKRPK
jgi:hypothetical protein